MDDGDWFAGNCSVVVAFCNIVVTVTICVCFHTGTVIFNVASAEGSVPEAKRTNV